MSRLPPKGANTEEPEDTIDQNRYPSPPPHVTHSIRGIHTPLFSSFQPRDIRFTSTHPMAHVAWSCDGRRLASVGIDKAVRIWSPDKSLEPRSAMQYVGGHDYDIDYVTWNPTHPELFCTSSQRDKRIVFWDARQSRCVQIYTHTHSPSQLNYSPDGKALVFTSSAHMGVLTLNQEKSDAKPTWGNVNYNNTVSNITAAIFNNSGDGLVLSSARQNSIMIVDYPSLTYRGQFAAHVGGCQAIAMDPRGRYLISGGLDSIVNVFDMTEWICVNTITVCVDSINSLSISHDGEYLAIASQGSYINICAVESGLPLHKVSTIGPSPTVTWHPSKYVFAYCGQQNREGAPQVAFLSLFGTGI